MSPHIAHIIDLVQETKGWERRISEIKEQFNKNLFILVPIIVVKMTKQMLEDHQVRLVHNKLHTHEAH